MRLTFAVRWIALLTLLAGTSATAAPNVSLELATEKGLPITGPQEWSKLLASLGISNVRIRPATGGEKLNIENIGTEKSPSYRISGAITAGNTMLVPGGKFSSRDVAGIRKWLENLQDQGESGITERRGAFGLIGKELQRANEDLKQAVDFNTSELTINAALRNFQQRLKLPIVIDASDRGALEDVKIEDNFLGLSSGTALAAILRPVGLVFSPERPPRGELHYRIAKPIAGRESWPVGWPTEKRPAEILPGLYEFINAEIADVPVSQATAAIAEQLKVPFLYDRNAMAQHQIDLTKVMANVPAKRSTYSLILQKVLGQAKMKPDLRLDEADKPFFWITSIMPAGK